MSETTYAEYRAEVLRRKRARFAIEATMTAERISYLARWPSSHPTVTLPASFTPDYATQSAEEARWLVRQASKLGLIG